MKIIKWWKTVPLELAGFTFDIVPQQEVRSDSAMFDRIVEAIKKSDCSYVLYEQIDSLIEERR